MVARACRHTRFMIRITPNAPTGLSTRRASAAVGYLTFRAARPRGSYVRSYQGRCVAAHRSTRYGAGSRSPPKVASTGYGPWSSDRKLAG